MRRREFIAFAGGAAVWPLTAHAQPQTPIVGVLRGTKAPEEYIEALRGGLGQSGYVDGKNVTIDIRDADGKRDRLSELTADLVGRRVAAIVANTDAVVTAIGATKTIPIVFVTGSDPVTAGFVRNLNRPGGNVTGVSFFSAALASKRLEILRELVPQAGTVALLVDPNFIRTDAEVREISAAGQALGLKIVVFRASTDRDVDAAFVAMAQGKVGGALVGAGEFLGRRYRQIVQSAAMNKIPSIHVQRLHSEAGGLLSYAASVTDAYRRAGVYIGRILKGEKAGDLPVELPTKFELVINLATAKALGLTVPRSLLARADEVIE